MSAGLSLAGRLPRLALVELGGGCLVPGEASAHELADVSRTFEPSRCSQGGGRGRVFVPAEVANVRAFALLSLR